MAKYIFVKVSDRQVVNTTNENEVIQLALKAGIVTAEHINDYVILKEENEGEYLAGTADLEINWH